MHNSDGINTMLSHRSTPPYASAAVSVCRELDVEPSAGLSSDEANQRSVLDGKNEISETGGKPAWRIFAAQFGSVVIWLLIFAAVVALFTDSAIEAAAIGVVLILNATVGFAIELQAGRSLEALRRRTRTTTRVRRDRTEQIIDSSEVVRGDIVILSAGDRVPADARLIEAVNLRSDESTLTGESVTVEKSVDPVPAEMPLAERHSMVFLGTNIVAGRAVAVITAIGAETELGRVGELLKGAKDTKTPLERRLAQLGRRLVYIVLVVALIVMIAGVVRGDHWWLMAEVSISLAVAAVPEGLPAVTTLILALGLLRMARRSAIVRHLASVETLGSTTVICTDKTGTLTENRMTVHEILLSDGRHTPLDEPDNSLADSDEQIRRILLVAVLCNEASYRRSDGTSIGDPTETALLRAAAGIGFDVADARSRYQKLREIPFDAVTKRMITVVTDPDRASTALLKGAPAVVLNASRDFVGDGGASLTLDNAARERFIAENEEMAARGLRVLAFADKHLDTAEDEIDSGYTFLGLMGIGDPPRPGAKAAVRDARNAGIKVVMLTGDQVRTAEAVARELGLTEDHDIFTLHSRDLAAATEHEIEELAHRAHVFARVTPEDKLTIVKALQRSGEIVAVTGDGINDAPALKQADIGIAFGERGTDVAKEAADIVLTNDNFSTIVDAIEGGRTIYANIIKFVHLMFSHNLGEILVIFGAVVAGLPLPLMPLQILWINLVTDVFPALALAVEPASPATMLRKPRPPSEALLSARFMLLIGWQGAMLAAISLGAYIWALDVYGAGDHARTVALLALIAVQLGHLFNCRSRSRSAFSRFFANPYIFLAIAVVVLLQTVASVFTPLSNVLGLVQPNAGDAAVILLAFVLPVAIVEAVKSYFRRAKRTNATVRLR